MSFIDADTDYTDEEKKMKDIFEDDSIQEKEEISDGGVAKTDKEEINDDNGLTKKRKMSEMEKEELKDKPNEKDSKSESKFVHGLKQVATSGLKGLTSLWAGSDYNIKKKKK